MSNLAVFASGGGSTLGALLDAVDDGRLDARVALVVTDRDACGALDRARARGIPTAVLVPKTFASEEAFGAALLDVLAAHDVRLVLLAGYLK